jgi:hypothetical protein
MLDFHQSGDEVFVPNETPLPEALERTTELFFAAYQDDIEIMAAAPMMLIHHWQKLLFPFPNKSPNDFCRLLALSLLSCFPIISRRQKVMMLSAR